MFGMCVTKCGTNGFGAKKSDLNRYLVASAAAIAALTGYSAGQLAIDPYYAPVYSFTDLGSIDGLPSQYGGLCTLLGDNNTLLIGGSANSFLGAIYSVPLIRDANHHIIGFGGPAAFFCEAAYNDGGITYGPNGVLFAQKRREGAEEWLRPGSMVWT